MYNPCPKKLQKTTKTVEKKQTTLCENKNIAKTKKKTRENKR